MGYHLAKPPCPSTFLMITQIKDLDDLLTYWPSALEDDPDVKEALPTILRCMSTGIVGAVFFNDRFSGLLVAEKQDSIACVQMLPKTFGRECVAYIKEWAFENGLNELRIISPAVNGSQFRFFEKTLGFRRKAVIFSMSLWPKQTS